MGRKARRGGKTLAFTLVEILVVIAIVVILMSLLFPALKTARDGALQIRCTGNMKNVGHAFSMYASDYAEWSPVIYGTGISWYTQYGVWPYLYPQKTYVKNSKIMKTTVLNCPKDTGHPDWGQGRIYCMNWGLTPTGWDQNVSVKLSNVKSHSGTLLFFESYDADWQYWSPSWPDPSELTLHHRNAVNTAFCDGHARLMKKAEFPASSNPLWKGK